MHTKAARRPDPEELDRAHLYGAPRHQREGGDRALRGSRAAARDEAFDRGPRTGAGGSSAAAATGNGLEGCLPTIRRLRGTSAASEATRRPASLPAGDARQSQGGRHRGGSISWCEEARCRHRTKPGGLGCGSQQVDECVVLELKLWHRRLSSRNQHSESLRFTGHGRTSLNLKVPGSGRSTRELLPPHCLRCRAGP